LLLSKRRKHLRRIASTYQDQQGYSASTLQPLDGGTLVMFLHPSLHKAKEERHGPSRTLPSSCILPWNVKRDHDGGKIRITASASDDSHEEVVAREQPLGRTCPSIAQLGLEFRRSCARAKLPSSCGTLPTIDDSFACEEQGQRRFVRRQWSRHTFVPAFLLDSVETPSCRAARPFRTEWRTPRVSFLACTRRQMRVVHGENH